MPNHKINWINDHTQICDRLDERVQLMQDYLDSKSDDFDGIAAKRSLLGQAREQVTWYRQSIEALGIKEPDPRPDVLCDPPRDRAARGFANHLGLGGRGVY